MNRRDLADKIEAAILSLPSIDASAVGEDIGNIVLTLLEKEGMKPPARKIDILDYRAMRHLMDGYDQYDYIHKWDE
jgi:hypothetical protein